MERFVNRCGSPSGIRGGDEQGLTKKPACRQCRSRHYRSTCHRCTAESAGVPPGTHPKLLCESCSGSLKLTIIVDHESVRREGVGVWYKSR
jgi:hypothetical protein